jgi:hypothetical protein
MMTDQKPRTYAQRLSDHDNWLLLPDNRQLLAQACKSTCRVTEAAAVLRLLVSKTSKISGTVDQTYAQISAATLIPETRVQRILKALTDAAVLITVRPAQSGGRNGGKGRAASRQVSYLVPEMVVQSDLNGCAVELNGCAADCTPLRSIPTVKSSTQKVSAETISTTTQQWIDLVADKAAQQLVQQATGKGFNPDRPDAFYKSKRTAALEGAAKAVTRFGAAVTLISPQHYEYSAVLTYVQCVVTGEGSSGPTRDLIEAACKSIGELSPGLNRS